MSADLALLILRVVVGLIVAAHGAQKLFGWFGGVGLRGFTGWMGMMGLRPPIVWSVVGGSAEFGGGLLLALGLLSPLGSLGVLAAMTTAIALAHWPRFWGSDNGMEYPLTNAVAAAAVGLAGPGAYSLDAALGIVLPDAISLGALGLVVLGVIATAVMATAAKRSVGLRIVEPAPEPAAEAA
jgi:putative oxidoreductase